MAQSQIPKDQLENWRHNPTTKLVWEKLTQDFNPWSQLLVCDQAETKKYQGMAAVLEALREFMDTHKP